MDITNIALAISDQRKHFWQWDTGRKLKVTGLEEGSQIHFHREGMELPFTVLVYTVGSDLLCDVPDELLQQAKTFAAYIYVTDVNGYLTKASKTFVVEERPKPNNYVYTPTEIKTWEQLDSKIADEAKRAAEAEKKLAKSVKELDENKFSGLYNDLDGAPVYDKTRPKIVWDGSFDSVLQKIVSSDGKFGLVRISDEYLPVEEAQGAVLLVLDYAKTNATLPGSDLPGYSMDITSDLIKHPYPWQLQDKESWFLYCPGSGGYYYFLLSVHSTESGSFDGNYEHSTFHEGLYLGYYNDDAGAVNEYVRELIFPENVKTLDNKLLDLENNAVIKALSARIDALESK